MKLKTLEFARLTNHTLLQYEGLHRPSRGLAGMCERSMETGTLLSQFGKTLGIFRIWNVFNLLGNLVKSIIYITNGFSDTELQALLINSYKHRLYMLTRHTLGFLLWHAPTYNIWNGPFLVQDTRFHDIFQGRVHPQVVHTLSQPNS